MIIDTHCHLDDEIFKDRQLIVDNFVREGGKIAIEMGVDLKTSLEAKRIADKFACVYFGAGFHPSELDGFSFESLNKIKELCKDEKCVAVGEIGLDYHFLPFDKTKQLDCFNLQIDLAYSEKLPFSIHSRDATFDTVNVLKGNRDKLKYGAVMHCFSGSKETAKILLDLGLYISFGGTLTFKNAVSVKEVASFCPLDRILTETDCPYLAPVPFRGSVNEPKNVKKVTEYLAELRGENLVDIENRIETNCYNLFTKLKK